MSAALAWLGRGVVTVAGLVPGWLWALIVAGALAHGQVLTWQRDAARGEVTELQALHRAAAELQAEQDAAAAETLVHEVEVIKYVYRDREKEVISYVPNPGTACPADADFVRRYNAGAAGAAADQ